LGELENLDLNVLITRVLKEWQDENDSDSKPMWLLLSASLASAQLSLVWTGTAFQSCFAVAESVQMDLILVALYLVPPPLPLESHLRCQVNYLVHNLSEISSNGSFFEEFVD